MQQLWFDSLPSTIEVAKAQLEQGCEHGLIVVAKTQTAGRGQFERRFYDEPEQALLYSQVLYLQTIPEDFAYRVGQSLRQFLETSYGIQGIVVKRPNDLYYDGGKLAGILIEPQYLGQTLEGVIVSVGMNIIGIPAQHPEATCLQMIQPQGYEIKQIASQLQQWFSQQFHR